VGPQGQQAFNRLAMAVASAEAPMFDLSKRMKDFMDTLGNTVKWSIASGAIHSVQGSLQRAVTHAEKLNKALNDIRIVTGYNTNTMADFANQARRAA
jgi:hypothetical protein